MSPVTASYRQHWLQQIPSSLTKNKDLFVWVIGHVFIEYACPQRDCIKHLYKGKDVFLWLPTGFGKSLCYEVLPFVFNDKLGRHGSVVIVISPLVSLMSTAKIDKGWRVYLDHRSACYKRTYCNKLTWLQPRMNAVREIVQWELILEYTMLFTH